MTDEPPLTPIERLLKPLIADLNTFYRNYQRWVSWIRRLQQEKDREKSVQRDVPLLPGRRPTKPRSP